jgi:DNA-binding NarL/FixJ family response regulator
MQPLSVLVVDDHSIVRKGICGLLSDEPGLDVVCEVASGEEAVSKAHSLKPDLILLDISLPGISGIAAARLIRKVSPQSRIIFLSQHDSPQMVREAFKSGGDGYVTTVDAVSELLEAIRAVREGNRFVSQRIRFEGPTEKPF